MNKDNKISYIRNTNIYPLNEVLTDGVGDAEAKIIAEAAKKTIEAYGGIVTEDNFYQLTISVQILLNKVKIKDKTLIIPMECGLGKSTLIKELLKYMLKHYSNYGALVVKERVEDALQLEKELGGQALAVYSFHEKYCKQGLKEYKREECRKCPEEYCAIKETVKEQIKYPVAIITSERLRIMMLYKKELGDFLYYKDKEGSRRKRDIVIIDEKPPIAINKALDKEKLKNIEDALENIDPCYSFYEEAHTFMDYIDNIAKELRMSLTRDSRLEAINPEFKLSDNLKAYFDGHYKKNDIEILEFAASIIRNGGNIKKGNLGKGIVNEIYTMGYINPYAGVPTIIFDGTATYDKEYKGEDVAIIDLPQIRDYSNFSVHNCNKMNLSRSSINKRKKNIKIEALADKLSDLFNKKILVLTYKEYKGYVKGVFERSQLSRGNCLYFDHFGNLKGKNNYADVDTLILLGLNRKSDAFYVAKAISLGIKADGFESISSRKGRISKNSNINSLFYSDLVTDTLQNIFRTKLRKGDTSSVKLYTFIKNPDLLDMITEYFTNCKVESDWYPTKLCKSYLENKTEHNEKILNLNNYLEEKFGKIVAAKKAIIKKKQIREDLGYVNQGTLQGHLEHELIKDTLNRLGVVVARLTLRKIC